MDGARGSRPRVSTDEACSEKLARRARFWGLLCAFSGLCSLGTAYVHCVILVACMPGVVLVFGCAAIANVVACLGMLWAHVGLVAALNEGSRAMPVSDDPPRIVAAASCRAAVFGAIACSTLAAVGVVVWFIGNQK